MSRTSRGASGTKVREFIARAGLRVMTVTALLALVTAASVIWLVLTQPVRVAGVVADGQVRSVAIALCSMFAGIGRALLTWL